MKTIPVRIIDNRQASASPIDIQRPASHGRGYVSVVIRGSLYSKGRTS